MVTASVQAKPQTQLLHQLPSKTDLPDGPLKYVVQGGSHSQLLFFDYVDMRNYYSLLLDSARRWHVRIHGFMFLPTYIQMLVSEMHDGDLSGMMQFVQSQHSKYLNRRHRNTWLQLQIPQFLEDADFKWLVNGMPPLYKVTVHNWGHGFFRVDIDPAEFAQCLRFIENSLVRAGLKETAAAWTWSSFRAHAVGEDPTGLTDMSRFETLAQREDWYHFVHRDLTRKRDTEPSPENTTQASDTISPEPPSDNCSKSELAPEMTHDTVANRESVANRHPFSTDGPMRNGNSEGNIDSNGSTESDLTETAGPPLRPRKGRVRHWFMVGLQAWQLRVGSFLGDISNSADILQDWRFMLPWLTACLQNFQSPDISMNFRPGSQPPHPAAT